MLHHCFHVFKLLLKYKIHIHTKITSKFKKKYRNNWWPELCSFLHVCDIREKLLARGFTRPPNGGSATITTFSPSDSVRKAFRTVLGAWQKGASSLYRATGSFNSQLEIQLTVPLRQRSDGWTCCSGRTHPDCRTGHTWNRKKNHSINLTVCLHIQHAERKHVWTYLLYKHAKLANTWWILILCFQVMIRCSRLELVT